MVYCTSFESRIGLIYVASTDKGVCKVSVPRQTKRDFLRWLRENFDDNQVVDNRSRNRGTHVTASMSQSIEHTKSRN